MFESLELAEHTRPTLSGPAAVGSCSEAAAPGFIATVASWARELGSGESQDRIAAESDAGLIDLLRGLEELKAAASAAQARVAAAFDASLRAAHARNGIPAEQQGRGAAVQVALARRESPARGGRILGFAKALTGEMPCTLRALSEGRISEWRATLLVRETACLSVEDRRLVDREIAGDSARLEGLGDGRLIAGIRNLTYRIDQEALVRRAAKAEADRYVSCRPAPDTMTYLTGLLPVAQGVAVFAALNREADSLRSKGDTRGRGQIMADTMVERITGQTRAGDVPVEVQLVMTDRTLLAGSREPAHLHGYGIVPSDWARETVFRKGAGFASKRSRGAGSAGSAGTAETAGPAGSTAKAGTAGSPAAEDTEISGTWLRRLYTAPSSGELIAMDSKARFVPAPLARLITARDQSCRTPWCSAPIRHQDHIRPHGSGGPTEATNIQGLCEACNHAKEAPGWRARVLRASDTAVPCGAEGPPGGRKRHHPNVHPNHPNVPPDHPDVLPEEARHTVETTTPTGHRYRSTAPPLPGTPWGR